MRLHLAECKINKHYINNEEFDVDTSNGTSTKMNAIKLSTYKNLCVVPEFGKIIPGSTLGESTLRYHHEYIFGCASCGLRHRGLHGYELLLTHQKVNRCKIEGVTIVKPHSWNNFQKKMNKIYEVVRADSVPDIKREMKKVEEEEKAVKKKERTEATAQRKTDRERKRKRIKADKLKNDEVTDVGVDDFEAANNINDDEKSTKDDDDEKSTKDDNDEEATKDDNDETPLNNTKSKTSPITVTKRRSARNNTKSGKTSPITVTKRRSASNNSSSKKKKKSQKRGKN